MMSTQPRGGIPALRLENLEVWYGPAQAVFAVDLDVQPGETMGILGRNGAGKTSVMLGILGLGVRRRGHVFLGDRDVSSLPVHRLARQGLSWVPDTRRMFPSLSVRDNFEIARIATHRREHLSTDDLVDIFPLLARILHRPAGVLSGGEQQVVAIARALVPRPSLLLIDEPTEGLAPVVVGEVVDALHRMRSELHQAVLLAEANRTVIERVASRVVVLSVGHVVFSGATSELAADKELQRAHLSLGAG